MNTPSKLSSPYLTPAIKEEGRPMWSVMILFNGRDKFLKECIESVLAAEVPDDEIQVQLIAEKQLDPSLLEMVSIIGEGRVRVCVAGEGTRDVLNMAIKIAEGKFVHFLCSCDRVKAGFYLAMDKLLWQYEEAGAAFCCSSQLNLSGEVVCHELPEMDRKGILPEWLPQIAERNIIPLGAMVVKRKVFEKHGGFYGSTFGAVWEMWARIAKYYPIAYTPEILIECREDLNHLSSPGISRESVEDLLLAMDFIANQLPGDEQLKIMKRSKEYYALSGLKKANRLWEQTHNKELVNTQIKKALSLVESGGMFYWKLLKVYFKIRFKMY